jgi:lysozyme
MIAMNPEDFDKLRHQLIRHEGLRLKPYKDSVGILTLGVGRNLEDRGITTSEALMLLEHDIELCVVDLSKAFAWFGPLDPMRKRVWIDLCFNMGISRLKGFTSTIAAMARSDYQSAAAHLQDSKWFTQVGKRGPWICQALRTGAEPPA